MLTRREILAAAAFALRAQDQRKPRPNILLISCENLGPHLGCYGDTSVATPALDAFAATAIRFTHAYAVSGIGPVSRSSIQTGMFPSTIGTHFNGRAVLPPFLKAFPDLLKQAGYHLTGVKSKSAAPPAGAPTFTWKRLDAVTHSKVRLRGATYAATIRPVKPSQRRGPDEAPFPPQFEDNEESRQDWSNYHELIALLDRQFAAALRTIADPQNTIVFFFSEYGFTLREGNSAAYESGTRVPLLIRGPGLSPSVSQRRVMLLDLAPTILNLAGIAIPTHIQGQPFLGDRLPPPRRTVFATLDRADSRYETIRSVRSGGYRFVCNYTKGTEELFDSDRDPNEVKNLTAQESATASRLREQLDRWRADTRDLGLIPEAELAAREAMHRTRYAVGRQPGFETLQQRLSKVALLHDDTQIREAFADSDAAVRAWACTRGSSMTGELRKALADDNATVRILAATALRKAAAGSQADAVPSSRVLLRELRSQEEWVRYAAILAVEELGERDPKAIEILRAASKSDPSRNVAALATKVLKQLETPPQ
jgi:arylsulfatase A-like enzyme